MQMDISKWNDKKRAAIHEWLERLRPWVSDGLDLGFTLHEIALEVRAEVIRSAEAKWGHNQAAKELGVTRSALWQAKERLQRGADGRAL